MNQNNASDGDEQYSRKRALALIQQYGWNNTSFQTLEPYFEYWFDASGPGVVAYYRAWGTWVVAGAPICPLDRMVPCARGFADAAKADGFRVCFFGTAARFAAQMGEHATHIKIGEQPCWEPVQWIHDRKRMQLIGAQRRRAERKGVSIRMVSPQVVSDRNCVERKQIEDVIVQWQAARRMATMSFVVFMDAFSFADERRYFLAERQNASGERVAVGFLSLVPIYARDGFFLEDLIRAPGAPNGTAEALIDVAMRCLAADGKSYATLGLTPLRNIHRSHYTQPRWATAIFRLSRRLFDPLYSFEGLEAFKTKLRPDRWEEVYVTGMPAFNFRMLIAVLMAFVRSQPTRFASDTLVRLASANLRRVPDQTWRTLSFGLACALVAWIGILSRCDGQFWFGGQAMLRFWIAFDAIMVGILFLLGYAVGRNDKVVRWLVPFAAAAVLCDVCLTVWQASDFFSVHAMSWRTGIAWTMAIAGPMFACLFLTSMTFVWVNKRK